MDPSGLGGRVGKARLWVNGLPVGPIFEGPANIPIGSFAIGGNPHVNSEPPFNGQIDEVRLSVFHGPFQPKMLLLPDQQNPQNENVDSAERENTSESQHPALTKKS